MKLSDLKLAIVYVNLAHREDRRAETEYQLFQLGLKAERQPGIKAAWVRDPWGFQNERRYACSLAKRLAIRRGFQTGAEVVLLLEDDVVFHPEFHDRLAGIDLPEDWGLFYLGCRHCLRPGLVQKHLVRCTRATDNHAVIVRRSHYRAVLRGLAGQHRGAPRTILYSDLQLASQQDRIPSYAAFPNLAWQKYSWSNTGECPLTAYHEDGRQGLFPEMMTEVEAEMEQAFPDDHPSTTRAPHV